MTSKGLVGVCIPTLSRPAPMREVLEGLSCQTMSPAAVIVVDASADDATEQVCTSMRDRFPPGVLRHHRAPRGLTRQRNLGIDLLRAEDVPYVCMLDDDVTLSADFLAAAAGFLESEEGTDFGGISAYDCRNWGVPFERAETLYHRIGLYDGELRPGRWLRCGVFLELSRLASFEGIHETDFIPGGHTVWRTEVFDGFKAPERLEGYALGEDKHLSVRVASRYRIGVLGQARVWHEVAEGGRTSRMAMAYHYLRNQAVILRDCDPRPTLGRYMRFLSYHGINLVVRTVVALAHGRFASLRLLAGSWAGWLSCIVRPPRRSDDAVMPIEGSA